MAQSGDDCYFFYYSKCAKGALCPFRHQEAALGTETVCSLWKEGRCFRPVCSFRHMDIQKKRSQIPCYWEQQPGGCQKPHCVFLHGAAAAAAPRVPQVDTSKESVLPTPDPFDWNILKTMHPPPGTGPAQRLCQELGVGAKDVPSPKVEQLVINPFEEESDQESMNGTPQKMTKSEADIRNEEAPEETKVATKIIRKPIDDETTEADDDVFMTSRTLSDDIRTTKIEGDANLGIKTLEEIQREKALQSLLRNKSVNKVAERPVTLVTENAAPQTRRVVVTSEVDSSIIISPKKPIKRNFLQSELKTDFSLDSSKTGTAGSPKDMNKGSHRSVKERLGLKVDNVADTKMEFRVLAADSRQRFPDENNGYTRTSAVAKSISSASDSDSDSSVRRKTDPCVMNRVAPIRVSSSKVNALRQPPSKVVKVEKPQVIIKSLDEIKREKSLRRREAEKSDNETMKSVRKTRPAIEIYQPPVRLRTGASVISQPNKKDLEDKPVTNESRKPEVQKNAATKKTDAWLNVKSFAEIMKEKQEKKQKDKAVDNKASENLGKDKAEKGTLPDEQKLKAEDKRNKISDVAKGTKYGTGNRPVVSDESNKKNDLQMDVTETNPKKATNGLSQPKHKFVPVVFDIESKPRAPKRSLSPASKSKQVSEPVLKSSKFSDNSASETEQKEPPCKSLTNPIPVAEKTNSVTSNAESATGKSRRLSQRLSSSGSIPSELKGKNDGKSLADNGTSIRDKATTEVAQEEEEDDFTKQLDDLIVDIHCIPNEDFSGLTDESQNDDDLLLEMQELLS